MELIPGMARLSRKCQNAEKLASQEIKMPERGKAASQEIKMPEHGKGA